MKAQDALKETGKAYKENNEAPYAQLVSDPETDKKDLLWEGVAGENVHYADIMDDDWHPYHEKKEKASAKKSLIAYNSTQVEEAAAILGYPIELRETKL